MLLGMVAGVWCECVSSSVLTMLGVGSLCDKEGHSQGNLPVPTENVQDTGQQELKRHDSCDGGLGVDPRWGLCEGCCGRVGVTSAPHTLEGGMAGVLSPLWDRSWRSAGSPRMLISNQVSGDTRLQCQGHTVRAAL